MTTDTPDDAVPVAELEGLAKKWREHAKHIDPLAARSIKRDCADELEALCADVEGERDE
jgi:hypothetical protein